MLFKLAGLKTNELFKILSTPDWKFAKKTCSAKEKSRKRQLPRDRIAIMRKISKLQIKIQLAINHQIK